MKSVLFSCLLTLPLLSLPTNGLVLEGEAKIVSLSDQSMEIHTSDQAFVQWDDFSIAESENLRFIQPSPTALAINRVLGQNPSKIFGALRANGQIILINPNGVIFGKNCMIDTGSMIASTLDLHSRERNSFTWNSGSSASIHVEGTIRCSEGSILLAAKEIHHSGHLLAEEVAFLGARQIDYPYFSIRGNNADFQLPIGFDGVKFLTNESQIIIDGTIACRKQNGEGGKLFLHADFVSLNSQGLLDVSAEKGNGSILFGNGNGFVSTAIYLGKETQIKADSKTGIGGKVICCAKRAAFYEGSISAGGTQGGFVEISAPLLSYEGTVDLLGQNGKYGTLLLDPTDINIGAVTTPGVVIGNPTTWPAANPINISAAAIGAALVGANVLINTSTPPNGGSFGDITISSGIAWATGTTLTLIADRDFSVTTTGSIVNSGAATGSIFVTAARNISIRGNVRTANTAAGTAGAGGTVQVVSTNGNITISSAGKPAGSDVNVCCRKGATVVSAERGDITLIGGTAANTPVFIGELNQGGAGITATGSITVNCQNLTLQAGNGAGAAVSNGTNAQIGMVGNRQTSAVADVNAVNITVNVARNLLMRTGPVINLSDCYIGNGAHWLNVVPVPRRIGDITVNVGGNLEIYGNNGGAMIGTNMAASVIRPCLSRIRINVGGNLYQHGDAPPIAFQAASIGGSADLPGFGQNLILNIGGNWTVDGRNVAATVQIFNAGVDLVNYPKFQRIFVGGDIVFISGNNSNFSTFAQIFMNYTDFVSRIWCLGSIRCYNGLGEAAILHHTFPGFGTANDIGDFDIRAGGDLILGGGMTVGIESATTNNIVSTSGALTYLAAFPFATGQLWVPQSAIVNGVNIFAGTPLGANSMPTLGAIGAVKFDSNRYDLSNLALYPTTVNGFNPLAPIVPVGGNNTRIFYNIRDSITIGSTDFFTDGTPADLTIGNNPLDVKLQSTQGDISISFFRNISMTGPSVPDLLNAPVGNILVIANNDMDLFGADITAGQNVILVVDNQAPIRPLIGGIHETNGGDFSIDAASSINYGGFLRIFTAVPNENSINLNALFNGSPISSLLGGIPFPGPFLTDSALEIWCTYYNLPPLPSPFIGSNAGGVPFTIFYKPCLQILTQQAMIIADEMLVDLHPYDEFPGWEERFNLINRTKYGLDISEPYYLRRRELKLFNHPKSWTHLLPYRW